MTSLLIGSVFYHFNLFSITAFIYLSYGTNEIVSLSVKFPLTLALSHWLFEIWRVALILYWKRFLLVLQTLPSPIFEILNSWVQKLYGLLKVYWQSYFTVASLFLLCLKLSDVDWLSGRATVLNAFLKLPCGELRQWINPLCSVLDSVMHNASLQDTISWSLETTLKDKGQWWPQRAVPLASGCCKVPILFGISWLYYCIIYNLCCSEAAHQSLGWYRKCCKFLLIQHTMICGRKEKHTWNKSYLCTDKSGWKLDKTICAKQVPKSRCNYAIAFWPLWRLTWLIINTT